MSIQSSKRTQFKSQFSGILIFASRKHKHFFVNLEPLPTIAILLVMALVGCNQISATPDEYTGKITARMLVSPVRWRNRNRPA